MTSLITFLTLVSLTVHIQSKSKDMLGNDFIGLSTCSAVWITPTEALTAGHCMAESTGKVWVLDADNKSFSAVVEKLDKKNDLCLLKVKAPNHIYAELSKDFVVKGQHIYTMNTGNMFIGTYGEGIVSNIIKDPEADTISIIHTAAILAGASGSGLFNARGEVVGINTAMYHNLSNAVDLAELNYFLTGNVR